LRARATSTYISKNHDDLFDKYSFNHSFLPRTDITLRETVSLKPIPALSEFKESQTYNLIAAFMHTIIMKEGRFYGVEQRKLTASLVKRQDFSVDAVFNTLCNFSSSGECEESAITFKSLAKFFRRNGFYASAEDVSAIIRRMDLNYDNQICRDELGKFL
jgi:hypothetical protein